MAISILDNHRIDRYELEVLVNHMNFTAHAENAEVPSTKNDGKLAKTPKYTVKITLNSLLKTTISTHDKAVEEILEGQRPFHYDEDLKSKDDNNSLIDITRRLDERYYVDENPICNRPTLCYNIQQKETNRRVSLTKLVMSKGAVNIFACMPRILITKLQKNPLELVVYKELNDEQNMFGTVCITLNGSTGFTDAIAYHFYEKGYDTHSHAVEGVYVVRDAAGHRTDLELSVGVKLTCHGPEKRVDQLLLRPQVRPRKLQPVHMDENIFETAFGKRIVQSRTEMKYHLHEDKDEDKTCQKVVEDRGVFQNSILADEQLLPRCQRNQESSNSKPWCSSPCSVLLSNVKRILLDDVNYADETCEPYTTEDMVKNDARTSRLKPTTPEHGSRAEMKSSRPTSRCGQCSRGIALKNPVKNERDSENVSVIAVQMTSSCMESYGHLDERECCKSSDVVSSRTRCLDER